MQKQTVLLVDDTPALLRLGAGIFESGGYEVLTAADGAEALEVLAGHTADLIVTDILMPNMDGYSLCFKIRNDDRYKDIPIIIYSATYTSHSDEQMALEIGAGRFIRKPASMDFMLKAAKELITKPKKTPVNTAQPHELSEVMKQYNSRLVEKLEEKNQELQQAQERLLKSNRLYAFISAINQSIVHITNEQDLLSRACQIAIDIGRFKLAWIGMLGNDGKLEVVNAAGDSAAAAELWKHSPMDFSDPQRQGTPIAIALSTGRLAVSNESQDEPASKPWKEEYVQHGIKANISLPIKRGGQVIGIFGFSSANENFFDQEEIALLEEVAGDISFALDVFDREKHRKQMEDDIRHSELRMKQAQAIAHLGNWELDFANSIARLSEEACRIYGIEPEDYLQSYESWLSFVHPDDLEQVVKTTEEAWDKRGSFALYHRIIGKDGGVRHVFSEAYVEFKNGTAAGLYGIVHDITEQKQAETERAKMLADLMQRNMDLEQFSYIVSHNLRGPVANIIGIGDVLFLPGITKKEERMLMQGLSVVVKELDEVVMDLNHILQVRQGSNYQREKVNLDTLLTDIELSISELIKVEKVMIVSDFSAVTELSTVRSYLYSIFYNLISNSIKYRRPEVNPVIEISSNMQPGRMELVFKDNGIGIDLEKVGNQVFGLYNRFHLAAKGKGVGLYMVKTQVETLGGSISVASTVNEGTEFRIQFKITDR